MIKRYCLIIIWLIFLSSGMAGQQITRYNTFSYSVNEGLLQTTIADIEIDRNNFCWISFPNGIQKFDGNNFITINVQPGLPDNKYASFFRCNNGDLLISHSGGISKYDIERNGFTLIYKKPATQTEHIEFIGEDRGSVYIYDESATIRSLDIKTYNISGTISTGLPGYGTNPLNDPKFSDNIIDHRVAIWINTTLYLLDLSEGKSVGQPVEMPDRSQFFLRLASGTEVLFYEYKKKDALQVWDFATNTRRSVVIKGKDERHLSRVIIMPWNNKLLMALNNQIFETGESMQVLRSELVNFQNLPVAGTLTITQIKEDNVGNLYLQTVTGGIKKLIKHNYPIKYFGTLDKENNSVLSILPDKRNNRILVGTNSIGLLVYDTLQRLIKHIPVFPGFREYFGINAISKDQAGDYLLFISGEEKIWKLSADLSRFTPLPLSTGLDPHQSGINYFGTKIYEDAEQVIVLSQQNIYSVNKQTQVVREVRFSDEYIVGGFWYNGMIISHGGNDLIFLDQHTFREIKKIPFPNTDGVRCFAKDSKDNILVGTNRGIFKIDANGKVLYHWNKENGLPDECIYGIISDNDMLWCSSNKGIFRIDNKNNILQVTREDGLQENEFNSTVVARSDDGELFFGGVNGVSSFYPAGISAFKEKITMLLTRVRVNNADLDKETAAWNIGKIELPYNKNSLSFDFVAIANNNPAQYTYQYKMSGIDNEWLMNSGLQTVRYSLPPGKYTFQLYASRSFDKDAKPMKEIVIVIKPPFWKTWWFLTAIGILFISTLIYIINQRIKRKYAKKLQQLENERQLKLERERISKDLHDSLGAYANAVLYNTDLLEKERTEQKRNELIGDLKFASKDIITSLRETVWALKKENYTAEDCLLRIRNFIQPFTRYYSHIHFKVTGEAPQNRILHYTKALNLVRIVQEAVSNSLKHAGPSNITVSSSPLENTWKIVIADDGKGFDLTAAKKTDQGNGLHNMSHRATESGFEFDLRTNNNGTTITIIL